MCWKEGRERRDGRRTHAGSRLLWEKPYLNFGQPASGGYARASELGIRDSGFGTRDSGFVVGTRESGFVESGEGTWSALARRGRSLVRFFLDRRQHPHECLDVGRRHPTRDGALEIGEVCVHALRGATAFAGRRNQKCAAI